MQSAKAMYLYLALIACVFVSPASAETADAACHGSERCTAPTQPALARDSVLLQAKLDKLADVSRKPADSSESVGTLSNDNDVHEEVTGTWRWWRGGKKEQEEKFEDWVLETSEDNEWIAGGDSGDVDFANLSKKEKLRFKKAARVDADVVMREGGEEALGERNAWRQSFKTEHKEAVRTLRRYPILMDWGQQPCRQHEGAGEISGLYTFGAPATALTSIKNPRSPDGKFPGLRMLNQRIRKIFGIQRQYSDPVSFISGLVGMKHPHMDTLAMPVGHDPILYNASRQTSAFPRSDMAFWIAGHFQTLYAEQLEPVYEKYDSMAFTMLYLSKAVSPPFNNFTRELNAAEAAKAGWNLVAQSTNDELWEGDMVFQDNSSLYQDPVTQACALSFVGTHHITHWMVNMKFFQSTFCGIPNVHKGFANQVRRVIRSKSWTADIKPALEACPSLYIVGHSLGGAQAQLVAACLQRAPAKGEDGWEDYQHLVWVPDASKVRTLPKLE